MIAVSTMPFEVADTFRTRLTGLLLGPPRALLLIRTRAIHTMGMRYPIDVWFLDDDGGIRRHIHHLRPWRIALCRSARHVLEAPSGLPTDLQHAFLAQAAQTLRHFPGGA